MINPNKLSKIKTKPSQVGEQDEPSADQTSDSSRSAAEPLSDTPASGLTQDEVQRRLARFGYNELAEKTTQPFLKLLSYFWGPIPGMIEMAALLSALVRHWADLGIILALLVVNAVVGFWEEYQAGNTIAALKAKLALQARVKRDGTWHTLPARELVPGDWIRLRRPFWSIRPARILVGAVLGTQLLATLIAVYGLFMAPLGWSWALLVWGYALLWFLVNDRIKLAAYRIFDWRQPGLLTKRVKP
jgi:magnesium-transporting ATPase (P-type)